MEPDWTFNMDDENAKLSSPPDEVRLPVEAAAASLRDASQACKRAATELAAAIRASGAAGYGSTGWILEATNLNTADVERLLQGEELF